MTATPRSLALLLALTLAASGCGTITSRPIQKDRPVTLELEWETDVGNMALLMRMTVDPAGAHICTLSSAGTAQHIDAATGARTRLALSLPYADADYYTAGAACRDDIVAAVSENGWLRVYDWTEGLLWQTNLKTHVYGAPLITEGKLYVVGLDGRLLAYTLKKGRELWRYVSPLENLLRTPVDSAVANGDGVIYAGIDNGAIVAIDKSSGEVQWENTVSVPAGSNSIANILDVTTPVTANDLVCASAYQGGVACFSASDGERQWHYAMSAVARVSPDAAGNRLFTTDDNGVLYALDLATGALLWRNKKAEVDTTPLLMGDILVAGNRWGEIVAFHADSGAKATTFNLIAQDVIHVAPLPGAEDAIVALTRDGLLFRLRLNTDHATQA